MFRFLTVLILISLNINSQRLNNEVTLKWDNDMFSSLTKDNYYTNGVFVEYRSIKKPKIIQTFTFAQLIYTPQVRIIENTNHIDRPFAGYLYIGYNYKKLKFKNSFYRIGIEIGTIGNNSKSGNTQDWFHQLVGASSPEGWDYQVEAGGVLQLNFDYYRNFIQNTRTSSSYFVKTNMGSSFINCSLGISQRLSFTPVLSITKSSLFDNQLNNNNQTIEKFVYIKPEIKYTMYDATIQGSIQDPIYVNSISITKNIEPFIFKLELGYKIRLKKNSFTYFLSFQTKETKEMVYKYNKYAGLSYSYIF
ncbi:MAG: lipid A deacylase LpxR family protein [Flavobacteriaceae bacterium]|nr:lipid A deacylase LpxR family protein [Flavobacteriaceae bacterium]